MLRSFFENIGQSNFSSPTVERQSRDLPHSSGLNLWTVSESEIAFLFESEIRSRFVFLVPTNQWNELVWKHIYVKTIARATFFTIFK